MVDLSNLNRSAVKTSSILHPAATSQSPSKAKDSSKNDNSKSSPNHSGSAGSKRKFKANAFYDDGNAMSAKRMKRVSMREATDGMKSTNPSPMAIPILSRMALPPDRPATGSPNPAVLAPDEALTSKSTESLPRAKCETTSSSTNQLDDDKRATTSLTELLRLGQMCAELLDSECVSE